MLSHVQLFAIPWTVAHQAPLSMGFSRQEYQSGLPCPPLEELPNVGIESTTLVPLALAGGFFPLSHLATRQLCKSLATWELNCVPWEVPGGKVNISWFHWANKTSAELRMGTTCTEGNDSFLEWKDVFLRALCVHHRRNSEQSASWPLLSHSCSLQQLVSLESRVPDSDKSWHWFRDYDVPGTMLSAPQI